VIDLRECEWLWHVDLDMAKHQSKADIQRTAGFAYDILLGKQTLQEGDTMVIVVVRPPTEQRQKQADAHTSAA
jgi:hypothetical protein